MKYFCLLLIIVAVFWTFFSPGESFVFSYAVEQTANIATVDPFELLKKVGNNIVIDANNMIEGFGDLSGADNPLDWLKSFGKALSKFFVNLAYLIVDVLLAPFQLILQLVVDLYNIFSVWLGLPYWSFTVPQFER